MALPRVLRQNPTFLGRRAAAVTPAISLSGVSVAPAAFYGTVRLTSYADGQPCCDVVRASDSASQTINFRNNVIDMAAAAAFAGGSALTVSTWYDQSGNALHATAASNRPKLSTLNSVNGVQAISFDGSNGAPVITCQMAIPAGLAVAVNACSMVFGGRLTISENGGCIVSLTSAGVTAGNWRAFQGMSYVATSTQTTPTDAPTNPATFGMSSGTNVKHYIADRAFSRAAITGTATSAGGIIGNSVAGTDRGMFEATTIAIWGSELSAANMLAAQAAIGAPFAPQTTFTDTIAMQGDSIAQGTGTTFNQNSTRQLWPLLKRPTRILNAGVFGATMSTLPPLGTANVNKFGGWTQTNKVLLLQSGTNDFAIASSNQGLSALPTIASGGTGYAASATFNLTTAGGTGTQAVVSVTTNGSGVVTTINSISNFGSWSVLPTTPNTPTGGAGSGCTLNLSFAVINTAAFVAANAKQAIAYAKSAGWSVVIGTILPRQTWVGTPAPWVEAQAYNADLRANQVAYGYDALADVAGDATIGNISNTSNTSLYPDGLHLGNAGWTIADPIWATAVNGLI
jgi:hypothetical protein